MPIYNPPISPIPSSTVYPTLAAMRAAGPPVGFSDAILLNRATAFDGGSGEFIWLTNCPNALVDDDCTVIIPVGAPAGAAWIRNFSGPVNVLWAGASTQSADNSPAFLNAQKAALNTQLWGSNGAQLNHGGDESISVPSVGPFTLASNAFFTIAVRGVDYSGPSNGTYSVLNCPGPGIITFNGQLSNITLEGNAGSINVEDADYCEFNAALNSITLKGTEYQNTNVNAGVIIGVPAAGQPCKFSACILDASVTQTGNDLILDHCFLTAGPTIVDAGHTNTLTIRDCILNMLLTPIPAGGLFSGHKSIFIDGLDCQAMADNTNAMGQANGYAQARRVTGTTTQKLVSSLNDATGGSSPGSVAIAAPVSGAIYQNTNPWAITVQVSVTYNPLAGAAATLTPALGPVNPPVALPAESEPAGLVVGRVRTYDLLVPKGYFYGFTAVNTVLGAGQITS